jgi:hypothetical protein
LGSKAVAACSAIVPGAPNQRADLKMRPCCLFESRRGHRARDSLRRNGNAGGILKPRALAVFILMTGDGTPWWRANSNLVRPRVNRPVASSGLTRVMADREPPTRSVEPCPVFGRSARWRCTAEAK